MFVLGCFTWIINLLLNLQFKEVIEARTVDLKPEMNRENLWFSIDNEEYEVKPIRVTLLPNILKMYYNRNVKLYFTK